MNGLDDGLERLCHNLPTNFMVEPTASKVDCNQPRSGDICVSRGRKPAGKRDKPEAAERRHHSRQTPWRPALHTNQGMVGFFVAVRSAL
jgi:hypothetical protein